MLPRGPWGRRDGAMRPAPASGPSMELAQGVSRRAHDGILASGAGAMLALAAGVQQRLAHVSWKLGNTVIIHWILAALGTGCVRGPYGLLGGAHVLLCAIQGSCVTLKDDY